MAVERLGTYTAIQSADDTGSQSVTIEAGTELVLLFVSGYYGSANWMADGAYTIGGGAFTLIAHTSNQTDNEQLGVWYRVNPATGSQTFAWDHNNDAAMGDGAQMVLLCYDNVNTASPIADSGTNGAGNDVTGMDAAADNMMVGAANAYAANMDSADDDGQTEIVIVAIINNVETAVGEELNEGDFYSTGGAGGSAVAVVIAAAAAGGETYNVTNWSGARIGESAVLYEPTLTAVQNGVRIDLSWTMPGD